MDEKQKANVPVQRSEVCGLDREFIFAGDKFSWVWLGVRLPFSSNSSSFQSGENLMRADGIAGFNSGGHVGTGFRTQETGVEAGAGLDESNGQLKRKLWTP